LGACPTTDGDEYLEVLLPETEKAELLETSIMVVTWPAV